MSMHFPLVPFPEKTFFKMHFDPIKVINIILVYVGISYLNGQKNNFHLFKYILQLGAIIFLGIIIIGELAYIVANADNFVILAEAVLINLTFDILFVKLLCHMVHRSEFKDIIDVFLFEDFEKNIQIVSWVIKNKCSTPKAVELKELVEKTKSTLMNTISYCLLAYGASAFSAGIIFDVKPLVLGLIHPDTHYKELPLTILSPWNDRTTPQYQITYMVHAYLGIFSPCAYVGLDCLFVLLMSHIIRQIKIIGFIMSNSDELVAEVRERGSLEWERDSTTVLANCAHNYAQLKWYCKRLNSIYKPFFVVQAICSSSIMCLCMFMLATSEAHLSALFLYVLYEITATVQIAVYCTIGQNLMDESERLRESVVGQWWKHGRRYRSCVTIFQAVVQRPITMYIWGSIDLSYYTFGAIAKTAVSYFTLLRTVSEK